jgi:hypothetical protein
MTYATLPDRLLDGMERVYSISMLWEGTPATTTDDKERQLLNLVLPAWQRPVVWDEQQQVRFIEGIFLGLGTGYYVINGKDWNGDGSGKHMSGWLLDGQQRITAIARFVKGELSIFDGVRYADLSIGDRRRRFDNVIFPCIELKYVDDEELLKTLYRRLNYGGTPHTQADLDRLNKA